MDFKKFKEQVRIFIFVVKQIWKNSVEWEIEVFKGYWRTFDRLIIKNIKKLYFFIYNRMDKFIYFIWLFFMSIIFIGIILMFIIIFIESFK